ncbi:MAG: ABC transporter ATP-binding protein/permease [Actinomycetota bacterium]|nr:ABC transporter ATP-binding protein/permease [Actinomycetota bacterium]
MTLSPKSQSTFRRLLGFAAAHRRLLVWSIVLALAAQGFALAVPSLTGRAIDNAIRPRDRSNLWLWVWLIIGAGATSGGLMVARRLIAGRLSLNVEFDLRQSLYTHLQRMSFGFYDKHQTGQLLSRATSDVSAVRMFLGYGLVFITQYGASLIAASVLLVITSWQLALITFVLLPPIAIVATRYSRRSHPVLRDIQQRIADVTTQAEESIVGVRVVKAFAQEDAEAARFAERTERVFDRELDSARIQARYSPLLDLLPQLAFAVIILVGGLLVIDGHLSLGGFITYNLYLAILIWPLRMIGMWIGQYQRAVASGERIFQVLDERSDIADPPAPRELPPGRGELRFEGVTFGYDADRPVLRELDFELAPGSTVALIGRTGSGKTTLTSLIPRYYDPQQGRVVLDGVDVRDLRLADLRSAIATVAEDTFLFSTTVAANIAYGAPGATRAEVVEAARKAQAHEFIEALPHGYDTLVGERGLTLSGGQRQRLSIARALLADPRILILDDATASVDATTEARIRRALETVMEGRTTIIIAHRLSTIALADEIVVLEDGRVAARGRHEQLVDTNAVYAEIWRHGLVERTFVSLDEDAPAEALS